MHIHTHTLTNDAIHPYIGRYVKVMLSIERLGIPKRVNRGRLRHYGVVAKTSEGHGRFIACIYHKFQRRRL